MLCACRTRVLVPPTFATHHAGNRAQGKRRSKVYIVDRRLRRTSPADSQHQASRSGGGLLIQCTVSAPRTPSLRNSRTRARSTAASTTAIRGPSSSDEVEKAVDAHDPDEHEVDCDDIVLQPRH